MRDQQHVQWHEGVDHIAYGDDPVDAEIEMHDQHDQRGPRCCHFYDREELNVFLNQNIHEYVQLDRTLTQQYQGQEGIDETQDNNQECREQRPGAVPVGIAVDVFLVTAVIASAIQEQGAEQGADGEAPPVIFPAFDGAVIQ